jgi:hypothetical protein
MISAKYNMKTQRVLDPLFYMWRFIAFLPPGALRKGMYNILRGSDGSFHSEVDGVWT